MMRKLIIPLLLCAVLTLAACESVVYGPEPAATSTTTTAATSAATTTAATTTATTAATTTAATTSATTTASTAATTAAPDLSIFEPNTLYEALADGDAPEDALALIINNPTQAQLDQADLLQGLNYDSSGETLLLIPRFNGMRLEILEAQLVDNELEPGDEVYFINYTEDGTGLHLEAIRPEGLPQLLLSVSAGSNVCRYILQYNGRDGTPPMEYINLEEHGI